MNISSGRSPASSIQADFRLKINLHSLEESGIRAVEIVSLEPEFLTFTKNGVFNEEN